MTEKGYIFPRLESGLFGLPPDLDVSGLFKRYADDDASEPAELSRSLDDRYGMSPQQKREQAFYQINELVAVYGSATSDDSDALSKLAAALGASPTSPENRRPALAASAAAAARPNPHTAGLKAERNTHVSACYPNRRNGR